MVFVDVPSNAQPTQHAAGRVIRIGQQKACTIYILTTDHSYDQVLQAAAARKMVAVIAAYTNRAITDAEVEHYKEAHPEACEEGEDEGPIRRHLLDESCADDYRIPIIDDSSESSSMMTSKTSSKEKSRTKKNH